MSSDPTIWLVARASGIGAYVALSLALLAGLGMRTRLLSRMLAPALGLGLHRALSLLALLLTGVHGLALLLDTHVEIPVAGLFLPGLIGYETPWTSIGVLTAELMVLIHVSFALRKKIGAKNWRRLHWLTYGVFVGATAHGIAAGTDTGRPWVLAIYAGAVAAAVGLTVIRALTPPVPVKKKAKAGAGATRRPAAPTPAHATGEAA